MKTGTAGCNDKVTLCQLNWKLTWCQAKVTEPNLTGWISDSMKTEMIDEKLVPVIIRHRFASRAAQQRE